ncbi:hypothetical protein GGU11DRAFT_777692 [Lentinula aff. detonsa]|nr:hypothetical protein GGU11DRAFT_777692 [Lentinula aff. detonsa]
MSGNDLILWLTRRLRSTVKVECGDLVAIPNFSPTQFEVLRVKWNRCRRQVPHVIYNGAIFNWVESILLVEPPFEEEKDVFCLELSSAIGSPEFLHYLLKANDLNSNLHAAVPPFGLGFLLSCESFRGELKSFEWLDMILGDVMRGRSGNNGESNAPVKDLYRDWLRRDRQPREHDDILTVESTRMLSRSAEIETSAFETANRKRPEPSADVHELGSASSPTSEPPSKRPRSSPSAPLVVKSRSGLLQWLSLTTTQIKPDHLNVHHNETASRKYSNDLYTQNTSKVCTDPEDPSGWVCVGSTSQYPSDTQNIIPQGPMNPGIESTSPSTRLPEIPLLSSFHLSSYDLEAPTCEEDKTRRSNDGAQIDSSNTVSSTSKSSSFLPLVANAAGKGHVERSVNPSDRDRSSDDSDTDTEPGNNPAHSKDFGNEASEETLDAAEVDALLKQDESSSFSNTSSAGSFEQSTANLSGFLKQSSQSVDTNDSSSSLSKIESSFFTALSSTSLDSIFSTSPF